MHGTYVLLDTRWIVQQRTLHSLPFAGRAVILCALPLDRVLSVLRV
jgi:hypothetical protein